MASHEYGIETDAMTLQRFVLAEQKRFPGATGDLTTLLTSLLTAFKAISSATQKAGLAQLYAISYASQSYTTYIMTVLAENNDRFYSNISSRNKTYK